MVRKASVRKLRGVGDRCFPNRQWGEKHSYGREQVEQRGFARPGEETGLGSVELRVIVQCFSGGRETS